MKEVVGWNALVGVNERVADSSDAVMTLELGRRRHLSDARQRQVQLDLVGRTSAVLDRIVTVLRSSTARHDVSMYIGLSIRIYIHFHFARIDDCLLRDITESDFAY